MATARTEAAKRQLQIWAEEFEGQAEQADREEERNRHGGGRY
jgi:hypothetical protein